MLSQKQQQFFGQPSIIITNVNFKVTFTFLSQSTLLITFNSVSFMICFSLGKKAAIKIETPSFCLTYCLLLKKKITTKFKMFFFNFGNVKSNFFKTLEIFKSIYIRLSHDRRIGDSRQIAFFFGDWIFSKCLKIIFKLFWTKTEGHDYCQEPVKWFLKNNFLVVLNKNKGHDYCQEPAKRTRTQLFSE